MKQLSSEKPLLQASPPVRRRIPIVVELRGLENFDEWKETLEENFAHHGLGGFLRGTNPAPSSVDSDYEEWNAGRSLAKAIVKNSTVRISGLLLDHGWNPKRRDPKMHYDQVIAVMVRQAEAAGLVAELIYELGRMDRADFESLAAYQGRLQLLRRRLSNFNYAPTEKYWLWIALNGLKKHYRHWHGKLEHDMAQGKLTWTSLMQAMYEKAVKEHTEPPSTSTPVKKQPLALSSPTKQDV